ncbi:hypothetical protein [Spirochaeta africana]|uniref:Uncharacterized protein n=1 Tax=Spirochaeta africana (strain ATCC 700263 / DSM 8902 / Z-7692) TaxID=889378 RepID=H9UJT3_SPIAZ|nr:hypothetical protein [Spirochaeta africana]AFG37776.1 hypothetical protein Spiaf_1719 [Spirochaeta africana DSM 8902]
MHRIMITAVLLFGAVAAWGISEGLQQADAFDAQDEHAAARDVLQNLLPQAASGADRAEVLWRLARAQLGYGGSREDAGAGDDELLAIFEQGEQYADQAIQADAANVEGYFWKASNIGRWGQTKGILDSLFKASDMRDLLIQAIEIDASHPDSYYVLSQLYVAVPRMISFGNNDYGVNLARKAVSLMEEQVAAGTRDHISYGFYITLAEALDSRGWSQRRRNREHSRRVSDYRSAESPLERGWYFEGTVTIPEMSDSEEARMVLQDMIRQIERMPEPRVYDLRDLEDARELLQSL